MLFWMCPAYKLASSAEQRGPFLRDASVAESTLTRVDIEPAAFGPLKGKTGLFTSRSDQRDRRRAENIVTALVESKHPRKAAGYLFLCPVEQRIEAVVTVGLKYPAELSQVSLRVLAAPVAGGIKHRSGRREATKRFVVPNIAGASSAPAKPILSPRGGDPARTVSRYRRRPVPCRRRRPAA